MARERWFYAHEEARHGPHQLPELVDALLALPEPRTRLVWTRGLESWTRAARVPRLAEELKQHLPEVAPRPPAPTPPPAPAPATATPATGTAGPIPRPRPAPTAPPPEVVETGTGLSRPALYVGGALLLAIAAGAVVLGFRGGDPAPSATVVPGAAVAPDGVAPPPGGAAPAGAADPATGAATGGDPTVVGWSAVETDVPATEFDLLKGVAAWEGDELTVTVYNGSRWRITEILVRTSVLEGDHFVDSALLYPLVPRQEVDANVAPILEQVAPDRRRPAVNPDDTRAFTGRAGEKPRAYRWRIEAARGYAPIIR